MKNTKGFTLIELLAVIVILAIIALIATPMILGVIDSAKKGAAESSAYGYIEAVEKSTLKDMIDLQKNTLLDGEYTVDEGGKTVTRTKDDKGVVVPNGEKINVSFKGDSPAQGGTLTVTGGEITAATLTINKYDITYNGKKATAQ